MSLSAFEGGDKPPKMAGGLVFSALLSSPAKSGIVLLSGFQSSPTGRGGVGFLQHRYPGDDGKVTRCSVEIQEELLLSPERIEKDTHFIFARRAGCLPAVDTF